MEIARKYANPCSENGETDTAHRLHLQALSTLENIDFPHNSSKRMRFKMQIEQATSESDCGKHSRALELRKQTYAEVTSSNICIPSIVRTCKFNLARSYHHNGQNLEALQNIKEVRREMDPSKELWTRVRQMESSIL